MNLIMCLSDFVLYNSIESGIDKVERPINVMRELKAETN